MVTNQIMLTTDRELDGVKVRQRTKDNFFALDDILAVGKLFRLRHKLKDISFHHYMQTDNMQYFLEALKQEENCEPYIKGAKNRTGWIHPYLAYKILLHFNPKFEVKVYKWLHDMLIQYRKDSGDSFIRMSGAIANNIGNKSIVSKTISDTAFKIKTLLKVDDWNKATQQQLKYRDYLQALIADLVVTLQDVKAGTKLALDSFSVRLENNQTLRISDNVI